MFAGDAAHVVSPFGARGANWGVPGCRQPRPGSSRCVVRGEAPRRAARQLRERARVRRRREHPALDARTDFITPKSERRAAVPRRGARRSRATIRSRARCQQRPAVGAGDACRIAAQHARRRRRLVAAAGTGAGDGRCAAGQRLAGRARWGRTSRLLSFGDAAEAPAGVTVLPVDCSGLSATRYDARPGTTYLIRPDRYVAARWRRHDPDAVRLLSPARPADRRRQWKARCDARSTSRSPTTSTMPSSTRIRG